MRPTAVFRFKEYLDQERLRVLPKSPEGMAISYALSNWTALRRYTEDGDLAIDNNGAEPSLRGLAAGRCSAVTAVERPLRC